jgi:hypothetical protein
MRQTGQSFQQRYTEHITSNIAQRSNIHICLSYPNSRHSYGNINTMEIISIAKKGRFLNSLEKYIYGNYRENKHINEISTDNNNLIFDTIYKHYINK